MYKTNKTFQWESCAYVPHNFNNTNLSVATYLFQQIICSVPGSAPSILV
jgi:hypothetical protein